MFTKNFKELSKNDALIAGGKGASLGEMLNAGISVPPGFVVTADAFGKFLEETDLNVEIESILATVDIQKMHTVEKASEKIQGLILEAKMPEDIKKEIQENFKKLGADFVAVRSSATTEDGAEHAWAGQLNSYLNTTKENLLENIQKCWASLFTPRAIFYRFEKGLHNTHISVAVVVQKMIQSEKSGIAFSVHPVTEDYNQLIIEAGYGLGEAIVSGSITPDSYVVDKSRIKNYELRIKNEKLETGNAIIDVNVNKQIKGLYKKENGGNEWRDIPEPQASSQVLSNDEIIELSELIIKIENHYNFPCDIEWAYESGKFYITQSRPITTLKKINETEKQEIGAVFSRPFSLLRMQFLSRGECDGIKRLTNDKAYFNPIFVHSPEKGMTAYYNFSLKNEQPQAIFEHLNGNIEVVKKELKIAQEACSFLESVVESGKIDDPKEVIERIFLPQPFSSLGNIVGRVPFATSELLDILKSFRYDYDGLIYKLEKLLLKEGKRNINKNLRDDVSILSFEELFEGKEAVDLEKRRNGFIYYEGEITTESFDDFLKKHNFYIKKDESVSKSEGEIKGNSAYKGVATGVVKKIYVEKDFEKFNNGDVLVAAMTIPDFLPIMKKAVAFVTDEGGITCHAAIVAREMGKPCIIGTKIATQVLKDGDLVEVDAERGIVKILRKAETNNEDSHIRDEKDQAKSRTEQSSDSGANDGVVRVLEKRT